MTCVNGDWLLFSWFVDHGIGELTADQPQFLRLRRGGRGEEGVEKILCELCGGGSFTGS